MNIRKWTGIVLVVMLLSASMTAGAAAFTPGTYEASAQGFGGAINVAVTVDEEAITAIEITGDGETPALGGAAIEQMSAAYVSQADADGVDSVAGATITSTAVKTAVGNALAQARGEAQEMAEIAFTPGTYEGTAAGYNGDVVLSVTFSEDAIEAIEVVSSAETEHVGDVAYDILFPEIIEYTSTGVDAVSGATFTSRAVFNAVNAAAEQAGCDVAALQAGAKPFAYEAQEPIEVTHDVVIVGAGGAGIAAAAQAAQNGDTVLVIETNAEVGGNTLVSGGQYQSVMPYLVWDPEDPDATTGVGFDGNTYNKVKSVQGCIDELKAILEWNEEEFDADYYKDHEFVAGDMKELSKHGVHADYLPVLKELKAEIQAYLDWAQPQLDAGVPENQLTLFSTLNLHIFQTYYGGLRQSADGSEWIYGDIDLVTQFIEDGQELKPWLEEMGSAFIEDTQPTLIGALWYRENEFIGADVDTDGDGETESYAGRWGTYFVAPMNEFLSANEANEIMLRTTAESLITDDTGRVIGVKATRYDGTEVTAYATKGVILATGGYAANIDMVLDTNVYWSSEYLTEATKTTNRSSLTGSGIDMAVEVGAATTGMGFTQLMPISWVDNGNLAFGGGNYAVYINPTTGKRFVDEGSERDVLSLAEFENGMEVNGTKGVFIEIYNVTEPIPGPIQLEEGDFDGRYYTRKATELGDLFAEIGVTADPDVVLETIRNYDMAVMGQGEFEDVGKAIASRTIGDVEKNEDGSYNVDTYDLENTTLRIRLMAPSTHHTMGGVEVDTERHVLDTEGNIIPGLYAAGEVTGGIHGGNRLGGNAIVEIFVSGRTAANAVAADAE